jgi:hypothetical protein
MTFLAFFVLTPGPWAKSSLEGAGPTIEGVMVDGGAVGGGGSGMASEVSVSVPLEDVRVEA